MSPTAVNSHGSLFSPDYAQQKNKDLPNRFSAFWLRSECDSVNHSMIY
jgi:hypothetical protein